MIRHFRVVFLLPCFFLLFAMKSPLRAAPPILNQNQDTFVLSNEGPGFLMNKLIAAGHGTDSLFQVVQFLAGMPQAGAVITNNPNLTFSTNFISELAQAPGFAPIFTTTLAQAAAQTQVAGYGVSVSIDSDGTVRYDGIQANTFVGTYPVIQTGTPAVPNVGIVYSTTISAPLNATTIDGPLAGMTTTYKAFAVAWAPAASPTPTAVPTLSEWGMFLLAGFLAAVATLQLHRRTRVSASQR